MVLFALEDRLTPDARQQLSTHCMWLLTAFKNKVLKNNKSMQNLKKTGLWSDPNLIALLDYRKQNK